jgi:hypothetical protein
MPKNVVNWLHTLVIRIRYFRVITIMRTVYKIMRVFAGISLKMSHVSKIEYKIGS